LAASTSLVMPPSWSLIKTWRGHRAGFLPNGSFMGHIGSGLEYAQASSGGSGDGCADDGDGDVDGDNDGDGAPVVLLRLEPWG
jgi:hypothetical protein